MNNIKFIALDLDGTLLNSKKEIPEGFFDYVKKHHEYRFCLSSGRQYYRLYDDFKEIGDSLIYIADNGAYVFDGQKSIYHKTMSKETIYKILDNIKNDSNILPIASGLKSSYVEDRKDIDVNFARTYYKKLEIVKDINEIVEKDEIGKIALYIKNLKAPEEVNNLPKMPEGTECVVSGKDWIDIAMCDVTKGEAIKSIQDILGIGYDNCMCFGDFMNDYSMFKVCKYGIAMDNGCDELKKIAYYITKSNDENGVMDVLENMDRLI